MPSDGNIDRIRCKFIFFSERSIETVRFQYTHSNGTKISIYRKNLEYLDSPLEIKLVDPSGRMTSIFNYDDGIDQLNVPLDTRQMLQKAIKVGLFCPRMRAASRFFLVSWVLFDEKSIIGRSSSPVPRRENLSGDIRWKTSFIIDERIEMNSSLCLFFLYLRIVDTSIFIRLGFLRRPCIGDESSSSDIFLLLGIVYFVFE